MRKQTECKRETEEIVVERTENANKHAQFSTPLPGRVRVVCATAQSRGQGIAGGRGFCGACHLVFHALQEQTSDIARFRLPWMKSMT